MGEGTKKCLIVEGLRQAEWRQEDAEEHRSHFWVISSASSQSLSPFISLSYIVFPILDVLNIHVHTIYTFFYPYTHPDTNTHLILTIPCEVGITVLQILQIRTPRHEEV